jgi:hypothetical protein
MIEYQYNLKDTNSFLLELMSHVDTCPDSTVYSSSSWVNKREYFGKFEWDGFTVYDKQKSLLQNKIILKINGSINANILSLNIKYQNYWISIINTVFLTVFSLFVLLYFNFYVGLLFLVIVFVQTYLVLNLYYKRKIRFIKLIESLCEMKY